MKANLQRTLTSTPLVIPTVVIAIGVAFLIGSIRRLIKRKETAG